MKPNFELERSIAVIGASASGTIAAGAKGVYFRCTAGTATITPNNGGTYKQFGNSVVVPLIEKLAESFIPYIIIEARLHKIN